MPVRLGEILGDRVDLAVFLRQPAHHVVHGLELVGVVVHLPGREGLHVVPGLGLGLGRDREQVLVADRGDEVDVHIDLALLGPFLHELAQRIVARGHPMIPEPDRELARGPGRADMHERENGSGGSQLERLTA